MLLKSHGRCTQVIPVLGQFKANVINDKQRGHLPVIEVKGTDLALSGKNWLQNSELKTIKHTSELKL